MKWNHKVLKYLYEEIDTIRTMKEETMEEEAKRGNYNFASMTKTEVMTLTYCLGWIVKVDEQFREINGSRI